MSELAAIRQTLSEIQKSTAATAEAVSWIKTGLTEHTRQLEEHKADDSKRISKLENRQHFYAGASGVLGVIFAALVDRYIGGSHS